MFFYESDDLDIKTSYYIFKNYQKMNSFNISSDSNYKIINKCNIKNRKTKSKKYSKNSKKYSKNNIKYSKNSKKYSKNSKK